MSSPAKKKLIKRAVPRQRYGLLLAVSPLGLYFLCGALGHAFVVLRCPCHVALVLLLLLLALCCQVIQPCLVLPLTLNCSAHVYFSCKVGHSVNGKQLHFLAFSCALILFDIQ